MWKDLPHRQTRRPVRYRVWVPPPSPGSLGEGVPPPCPGSVHACIYQTSLGRPDPRSRR